MEGETWTDGLQGPYKTILGMAPEDYVEYYNNLFTAWVEETELFHVQLVHCSPLLFDVCFKAVCSYIVYIIPVLLTDIYLRMQPV